MIFQSILNWVEYRFQFTHRTLRLRVFQRPLLLLALTIISDTY